MEKSTIDDVAALAGVSIKTVSRVVNNHPNVSPTTREKIEAAIKKLNYRPNQSARSLAGFQSFLVGLLYSNPGASYVIQAQGGILEVCRKEDYSLLIHPCDHRSAGLCEEVNTLVREARLDGLILTPPLTDNQPFLEYLKEHSIRYVTIAPVNLGERFSCVFCDNRMASQKMTEHLIELGHTRIGFILGHPDHGETNERYMGYGDALKKYGIKENECLVVQGFFDSSSGRESAEKLLNLEDPPTAIFASSDYMAAGAMVAVHNWGLRIPQQISIAGFDDIPLAMQAWPPLTTIRQPIKEMAAKAAELLINQVREKSVGNTQHAFSCSLIKRESTGMPKTRETSV